MTKATKSINPKLAQPKPKDNGKLMPHLPKPKMFHMLLIQPEGTPKGTPNKILISEEIARFQEMFCTVEIDMYLKKVYTMNHLRFYIAEVVEEEVKDVEETKE